MFVFLSRGGPEVGGQLGSSIHKDVLGPKLLASSCSAIPWGVALMCVWWKLVIDSPVFHMGRYCQGVCA